MSIPSDPNMNELPTKPKNFFEIAFDFVKKNVYPQPSKDTEAKKQLLRKVILFRDFTEQELNGLLPMMQEMKVETGDIIVKEGELSNALFILQDGVVEFVKGATRDETPHQLGVLQPGECFGEMALLKGAPQWATVRASEASILLVISEQDLARLNARSKAIHDKLMTNLALHLHKTVNDTSRLTVFSLEKELELSKRYAAMSRFLIYTLLLWAGYNLVLDVVSRITQQIIHTEIVSAALLVVFATGNFFMLKQSGYSFSFYGITLENWKASLKESLIWTFLFMAVLTGLKWILITTVPEFQSHAFFEYPSVLSTQNEYLTTTAQIIRAATIYMLFVPLQEFIFRGAIQGSLQNLLSGPRRTFWAVSLASILFSMSHFHLSVVAALISFIPSFFWGILYARHRTLLGVCVSHILLGSWCLFVLNVQGLVKPLMGM